MGFLEVFAGFGLLLTYAPSSLADLGYGPPPYRDLATASHLTHNTVPSYGYHDAHDTLDYASAPYGNYRDARLIGNHGGPLKLGNHGVGGYGGGHDFVGPIGGGHDIVRPYGGGHDVVGPYGGGHDIVGPYGGSDVGHYGGGHDIVGAYGDRHDVVGPYGGPHDVVGPYGGPDVGPYGGPHDVVGPYGGPDVGPYGGPDVGPYGGPHDVVGPYGGPDVGPYGGGHDVVGPYGGGPYGGPHDVVGPYGGPGVVGKGVGGVCGEGKVLQVDGSCVVPIVHRKVYVYAAPVTPKPILPAPKLPKPEVLQNVVLIRAPEPSDQPEPIVIPPPTSKNVVYVLNKQKDNIQKVLHVPTPPHKAPEVYFINYRDSQDLRHSGLKGFENVDLANIGVAPILDDLGPVDFLNDPVGFVGPVGGKVDAGYVEDLDVGGVGKDLYYAVSNSEDVEVGGVPADLFYAGSKSDDVEVGGVTDDLYYAGSNSEDVEVGGVPTDQFYAGSNSDDVEVELGGEGVESVPVEGDPSSIFFKPLEST